MPIGTSFPDPTSSYTLTFQTTRGTGRTMTVQHTTSYGEDQAATELMVQDMVDLVVASGKFTIIDASVHTSAWAEVTTTPVP